MHTLTESELPKMTFTIANSYGDIARTADDYTANLQYKKLVAGSVNNSWASGAINWSFGGGKAYDNRPPYIAVSAHVRAG